MCSLCFIKAVYLCLILVKRSNLLYLRSHGLNLKPDWLVLGSSTNDNAAIRVWFLTYYQLSINFDFRSLWIFPDKCLAWNICNKVQYDSKMRNRSYVWGLSRLIRRFLIEYQNLAGIFWLQYQMADFQFWTSIMLMWIGWFTVKIIFIHHIYRTTVDHFTFTLTDLDSKFKFGFCRHATGAQTCFCIVR